MIEDYKYNLVSYASVILNNNKDKLKDINELILELITKDGNKSEEIIQKDDLSDKLIEIFNNDVSHLSEVNINYKKDNFTNSLNGITIF